MSPTPAADLFHHFKVVLDAGTNPLFAGGERITGCVKIKLKKDVAIEVIRIQFKGRACLRDHKKGHGVEKIFFDKDFVLLERPPGKPDPGNFLWKADFDYSLPFEYLLPVGCPNSFESSDAFVRYFARATLQTSEEQNSANYVAKRHFSIYDLESSAAIDPQFEQPYVHRRSFALSGCCCCKRNVYLELAMPKRAFYPGEPLETKLLVDNIRDTRIAENIAYNIVERVAKANATAEEVGKHPARVLKSGTVSGDQVDRRRNTVTVGELLFPAAPVAPSNALALSAFPRDKSSPQLSPDDQAGRLFDHPSVISQSRKEPLFDVHYALQILLGKILIEVPFVVRPTDSVQTKAAFHSEHHEDEQVKFVPAQVTEGDLSEKFKEPDEDERFFISDSSYSFVPWVPVYKTIPQEQGYEWPALGTYDSRDRLVWHPDKKESVEKEKKQKKKAKKLAKVGGDETEKEVLLLDKADELVDQPVESIKVLETNEDGKLVESDVIETKVVRVVEHHGEGPAEIKETVTVTEQHNNQAPVTTTYESVRTEQPEPTPEPVVEKHEPVVVHEERVVETTEHHTAEQVPESVESVAENGVVEEVVGDLVVNEIVDTEPADEQVENGHPVEKSPANENEEPASGGKQEPKTPEPSAESVHA